MKISKNQNLSPKVSFKGMAKIAPRRIIRTAQDAIEQWRVLKHPEYTNIFQETENVVQSLILENKQVRDMNYNFLDELKSVAEKSKFIEHFKKLTGFPSLEAISKNMLEEFRRVLKLSAKELSGSPNDVLLSGYDKFCSVGLRTSLPGSDLDKGYAIIKGPFGNSLSMQKDYSDKFKTLIWNNIDNRILSVNHCAAFPNIMTDKEVALSLNKYEPLSNKVIGTQQRYNLFLQERMNNKNPVSSAKFNIWLSELLSKSDKVEAKNLAYVIEAIRDGAQDIFNPQYGDTLSDLMNKSSFSWCSNVCQGHVMRNFYETSSSTMLKPKLKARKDVEKYFNSWGVNKQYELVKDIIRSMSGDNKNKMFNDIFHSKTDKHRLLINDILVGDVDAAFDFFQDRERLHLFLKTEKARNRYYNFDVYKMDY